MEYIFIHGLGQDSLSWDKTSSFMEKSNDILVPDLAILLKDKEVTYDNLYKAFSDYCNNFSEKLNLCGLSLGGVLALNYAIDYPKRVNSLVLIGAPYKIPKKLLKVQNTIFKFMPEATFKNMGFQKQDFINLTNSMGDLDFSENLKDISCETLVICGEKDNVNKKATKALADNIKGAKLKFIKKAGHEVNTERPEELATELKSFYQG